MKNDNSGHEDTAERPTPPRTERGRFAPGNKLAVGNRGGGRPPGQTITAELRRQADPEAIASYLLKLIDDSKAAPKDRLRAAELVLDRLEGKARQHIDINAATLAPDEERALEALSTEQLKRVLALESERDAILGGTRALVEAATDASETTGGVGSDGNCQIPPNTAG